MRKASPLMLSYIKIIDFFSKKCGKINTYFKNNV